MVLVDKMAIGKYNNHMTEAEKTIKEDVLNADKNGLDDDEASRIKKFQSHDGIFRFIFSAKEAAESFIREYLPADITQNLDFSTLKKVPDTFVDQKLSSSFSDALYYILYKENPAYLYFLFEHKSWEPRFPGVQVLKNMGFIWENYLLTHEKVEKLPVIIPLIIYHGQSKWKGEKNFRSHFAVSPGLEKYIPMFDYELYDIYRMPEEQIKGIADLRIMLMLFKYIFSEEILSRMDHIFKIIHELTREEKKYNYLEAISIYLASNIKEIKLVELQEKISQEFKDGGNIMTTIAEKFINQGIEKGIEKGRQEGIEKGKVDIVLNCLKRGMDIGIISEITQFSIDQIKALSKSANQGQGNLAHT